MKPTRRRGRKGGRVPAVLFSAASSLDSSFELQPGIPETGIEWKLGRCIWVLGVASTLGNRQLIRFDLACRLRLSLDACISQHLILGPLSRPPSSILHQSDG